jgi:hypothetical protein
MDIQDIISIIIGILGIGGMVFTVYNSFKKPQIQLEKEQALTEVEIDNNANLLRKQFDWDRDANEKKFCELGKKIEDAFLLASNHTHTVDTKVDKLIESVAQMGLGMTKLSTIIEERIPKK